MMSEHTRIGLELVLAMMRSASTDRIDPRSWWPRATTALQTGAAIAQTFSELVSVMARKLEIVSLRTPSAQIVARLSDEIGEDFEAFRQHCEDEAVFVVAMAQAGREAEREGHDLPEWIKEAFAS